MSKEHLMQLSRSRRRPVLWSTRARLGAGVLMLAAAVAVTWVAVPGRTATATTATARVTAARTLVVTAKPGVENKLSVSFAQARAGKVVIRDQAGRVAAAAPCRQGFAPNQAAAVCPLSAVRSVAIDAGDRSDRASVARAKVGRRTYPATIQGGPGNDAIYTSWGADRLIGGDGDDRLSGGPGNDGLDGGPGRDTIYGGDGADRLYGFDGDDLLSADAGNDRVVVGGPGNDSLSGDAGDDLLRGGDGADSLLGGTENDLLYGDGGNDRLDGGYDSDDMVGGAGTDTVSYEGRQSSVVIGIEPGNAYSGGVEDTLQTPNGSRRDDVFEVENAIAGSSDDVVYARTPDVVQQVYGGPGNDQLYLQDGGGLDLAVCGAGASDRAFVDLGPAVFDSYSSDCETPGGQP
jgi:hypothetical protein